MVEALPTIDRDIRAVKWRLWHGRVDRVIRDLEQLLERVKDLQGDGEFSIARLHSLGAQLLTYVRSNRDAIINYGKRYRAGLRVATTLPFGGGLQAGLPALHRHVSRCCQAANGNCQFVPRYD